jgi:hypothetical protein
VATTAGTLAAADTVTPVVADGVTAANASVSLSICAGDAAGAAEAGELAAIAAAAIASGAVALPDAGVAGPVSVATLATAIAAAIGFGVVTEAASRCDTAAATTEEPGADEESGAEADSDGTFGSVDFFSVGFARPVFKSLGFTSDC